MKTETKKQTIVPIGQVKKIYRVIIHQKLGKHNKKEATKSFTIRDYDGTTTLEKIKEKLQKIR